MREILWQTAGAVISFSDHPYRQTPPPPTHISVVLVAGVLTVCQWSALCHRREKDRRAACEPATNLQSPRLGHMMPVNQQNDGCCRERKGGWGVGAKRTRHGCLLFIACWCSCPISEKGVILSGQPYTHEKPFVLFGPVSLVCVLFALQAIAISSGLECSLQITQSNTSQGTREREKCVNCSNTFSWWWCYRIIMRSHN